VYACLKDTVSLDGKDIHINDLMSADMYKDGVKLRDWNAKDLLPLSAKLIPEFDRRRSIRDMFTRKPSITAKPDGDSQDETSNRSDTEVSTTGLLEPVAAVTPSPMASTSQFQDASSSSIGSSSPAKRPNGSGIAARPSKRTKPGLSSKTSMGPPKDQPGKGQSSLTGFFKPKSTLEQPAKITEPSTSAASSSIPLIASSSSPRKPPRQQSEPKKEIPAVRSSSTPSNNLTDNETRELIDPIVAKESWSKLLGKRILPRCEHDDPCASYVTKKAGINAGRSFYMCSRPLGPSGQKEKNTEWRCGTFIWSSDWTSDVS
jgi:AP endonuclease-2